MFVLESLQAPTGYLLGQRSVGRLCTSDGRPTSTGKWGGGGGARGGDVAETLLPTTLRMENQFASTETYARVANPYTTVVGCDRYPVASQSNPPVPSRQQPLRRIPIPRYKGSA